MVEMSVRVWLILKFMYQFQGSLAAQGEEDATGRACSIEVFMISTPSLIDRLLSLRRA